MIVADAELTARSPAGDVVLAYIRKQVLAIARYDPLVRRDAPDAVHQMRVATRRARSALQAFGQIIDREATRSLGEELKWLAAELGHARDSEVMLARLTAELAAVPPVLVVGRFRPASPATSPPNSPRRARRRCTPSTGRVTSACATTWTCSWPIRR